MALQPVVHVKGTLVLWLQVDKFTEAQRNFYVIFFFFKDAMNYLILCVLWRMSHSQTSTTCGECDESCGVTLSLNLPVFEVSNEDEAALESSVVFFSLSLSLCRHSNHITVVAPEMALINRPDLTATLPI